MPDDHPHEAHTTQWFAIDQVEALFGMSYEMLNELASLDFVRVEQTTRTAVLLEASTIAQLRRTARLIRDFELGDAPLVLVLSLLERIDHLERQLSGRSA
ncbi:MAG: hypothetical protein JNM79_09045 [Burkholderiales bacterium]|nr:hypothetical protein [Burkholderiales bacterium]